MTRHSFTAERRWLRPNADKNKFHETWFHVTCNFPVTSLTSWRLLRDIGEVKRDVFFCFSVYCSLLLLGYCKCLGLSLVGPVHAIGSCHVFIYCFYEQINIHGWKKSYRDHRGLCAYCEWPFTMFSCLLSVPSRVSPQRNFKRFCCWVGSSANANLYPDTT